MSGGGGEGGERRGAAQSCPTLRDPVHGSPPDISDHGILQATVLEWAAISFSKGSSRPGDRTRVSRMADRRLPSGPPGRPARSLMCFNSRTERCWCGRRNHAACGVLAPSPSLPPHFKSRCPTPEPPSRAETRPGGPEAATPLPSPPGRGSLPRVWLPRGWGRGFKS